MTFPDIANLVEQLLSAAGWKLCREHYPDADYDRAYSGVRDVIQKAFDEAMKPAAPPAPVPALERAGRLIEEAKVLLDKVARLQAEQDARLGCPVAKGAENAGQ